MKVAPSIAMRRATTILGSMLLHGLILFALSWRFGAWDAEEIRVEPPRGKQDSVAVSVRTEAAQPEWTGEASTELSDPAPEAPIAKKAKLDPGRHPPGRTAVIASKNPTALEVPKGEPESEPEAKPIEAHTPKPEYPKKAHERGWEGTATVEFTIRTDGTCVDCRLVKSSGYDLLDKAALKTAATWRYQPIRAARTQVVDFIFRINR